MYYQDPLIDFINIWHDGTYISFSQYHPQAGHGFEVKVTDSVYTYVKGFAYIIKTLLDFSGICYGDSYKSKVLFNMIHAPMPYL